MTVIQPYRSVAINGTAQIPCFIQPQPSFHQVQPSKGQSSEYPYHSPRKVRVALLKGLQGLQELCSSDLDLPESKERRVEKHGEVGLNDSSKILPNLQNPNPRYKFVKYFRFSFFNTILVWLTTETAHFCLVQARTKITPSSLKINCKSDFSELNYN